MEGIVESTKVCHEDQDLALVMKLWEHHNKRSEFDLEVSQWLQEYPDLLKLLHDADRKKMITAWPNRNAGDISPDEKIPALYFVRILPSTLEMLKERRKVHRQAIVDGGKVDLRSGSNHMLFVAPIENLVLLIPHWTAASRDVDRKVRRSAEMNLVKFAAYRRHELSTSQQAELDLALREIDDRRRTVDTIPGD